MVLIPFDFQTQYVDIIKAANMISQTTGGCTSKKKARNFFETG